MKKRKSTLLALILATSLAHQNFSQDLKEQGKKALKTHFAEQQILVPDLQISRSYEKGKLTILESDDPPGFIVLIKNEGGVEIAAYSTENKFSEKNDFNPVSIELLEGVKRESRSANPFKSGIPSKLPVGPMLKTKWNQDEWFNRYCPYSPSSEAEENTYAGCVAVAMGQILKYFGPWNHFKVDDCHSYFGDAICSSGVPFDWALMLDHPLNYDLEICRLLSDLGILISTTYGCQSSSASTGFARRGLNTIGYSCAHKVERRNFDKSEWLQIIYKNLENYHPVLVAGNSHAFVCDGYDQTGMLHFNIGGGGTGDGYYLPDCVYGKYSTHEAILDIFPENDFEPAKSLRIQEVNNTEHIVWSPPAETSGYQSFRIYYSDNEYIESEDTLIRVDDLKPGTFGIKISTLYPDGESLWIGPVWTRNQGELITITDPAIIRSLSDNPLPVLQCSAVTVSKGDLADRRILKVIDSVRSTDIVSEMYRLQVLEINGEGLEVGDFDFLAGLKNLQTLRIYNLNCDDLSMLQQIPKLVELELENCNTLSLDFLAGIKNLVTLKLKGGNLGNAAIPSGLVNLEKLVINDIEMSSTGFLDHCKNLKNLDLSDCQLTAIDLHEKLTQLSCVNLNNNLLSSLEFLDFLPAVKSISMTENKLVSLDIFSENPNLKFMDVSHNGINSVSISYGLASIQVVDLSFNKFLKFPDIFHAMVSLSALNLGHNSIERLPELKLPNLDSLDISSNRLKDINYISRFNKLQNLNLRENGISDFSPLIKNDFYNNLTKLDIDKNPVSLESYLEVVPKIAFAVNDFRFPEGFENRSPCYPNPEPRAKQSEGVKEISWQCETDGPDTRYNVFFGVGDSIKLINTAMNDKKLSVSLDEDQVYHWQVQAVVGDTSFYSGKYEIRTTGELKLPYFEDFELLAPGEKIGLSSSNWRLSNGNICIDQDAEIKDLRQPSGNINSLQFHSGSNLTIDLDHIAIRCLTIQYEQYIEPGGSADICLKNVAGQNFNILTGYPVSWVYTNGRPETEFEIIPGKWNLFIISINGTNGNIIIKCNDHYVFHKECTFNRCTAEIEGLVFCPFSQDSNEFNNSGTYLDNLSIYDVDHSTSSGLIEEKSLTLTSNPNPAADYFYLEGFPARLNECTIKLFNGLGQMVFSKKIYFPESRIRISTENASPGIYFYHLLDHGSTIGKGKILISK